MKRKASRWQSRLGMRSTVAVKGSLANLSPRGQTSHALLPRLASRNLSYNNLTRLDEGILSVLGDLHTLRLGHNSISHITEGAFRGLKALRNL